MIGNTYTYKTKGSPKFQGKTKNIKFYRNRDRIAKKKKGVMKAIGDLDLKDKVPTLYDCKKGALTGNFYAENLAVRMKSQFYHNSANYLKQEDIDKLINSPKIFVENYKMGGGHF